MDQTQQGRGLKRKHSSLELLQICSRKPQDVEFRVSKGDRHESCFSHRDVIRTRCPSWSLFAEIEEQQGESGAARLVVDLPGMDLESLEHTLHFIYTGTIDESLWQNVSALTKLYTSAHYVGIEEVVQHILSETSSRMTEDERWSMFVRLSGKNDDCAMEFFNHQWVKQEDKSMQELVERIPMAPFRALRIVILNNEMPVSPLWVFNMAKQWKRKRGERPQEVPILRTEKTMDTDVEDDDEEGCIRPPVSPIKEFGEDDEADKVKVEQQKDHEDELLRHLGPPTKRSRREEERASAEMPDELYDLIKPDLKLLNPYQIATHVHHAGVLSTEQLLECYSFAAKHTVVHFDDLTRLYRERELLSMAYPHPTVAGLCWRIHLSLSACVTPHELAAMAAQDSNPMNPPNRIEVRLLLENGGREREDVGPVEFQFCARRGLPFQTSVMAAQDAIAAQSGPRSVASLTTGHLHELRCPLVVVVRFLAHDEERNHRALI